MQQRLRLKKVWLLVFLMFMTNIPRRKIYEAMLRFEDAMISMHILIYNEEHFKKFYKDFHDSSLDALKVNFVEIEALLLMFLENRKYPVGHNFEKDLHALIEDREKTHKALVEYRHLPEEFRKTLEKMEETLLPLEKIEDLNHGKELYPLLDEFNSGIPKILEIRRDELNPET